MLIRVRGFSKADCSSHSGEGSLAGQLLVMSTPHPWLYSASWWSCLMHQECSVLPPIPWQPPIKIRNAFIPKATITESGFKTVNTLDNLKNKKIHAQNVTWNWQESKIITEPTCLLHLWKTGENLSCENLNLKCSWPECRFSHIIHCSMEKGG